MVAPNKVIQGTLNLVDNVSTQGRAAPTAIGVCVHVSRLLVQNKHATVATVLEVLSGATIIHRVNLPAAQTTPVSIPALDNTPLRCGPNTALNFRCVTTGSDVLINWGGFEAT